LNRLTHYFAGTLVLAVCMLAYAQSSDMQLSGAKRYKTLAVETVYPYSIESYQSSPPLVLSGVSHTQATPEITMVEMFASMRGGDWTWNSSLWSPESLKEMDTRDRAAGKKPSDWIKLWQQEANRTYHLLNRIEYGKYVLIEYEAKEASGKKAIQDTMALEKIGEKWYLTQALAADPILMHWNNPAGRTQVAPNTLFKK
jgi:hypothetical protein